MRCFSRAELEASYQSFNKVDTVVLYYFVVWPMFYHEGKETDRFDLHHYEIYKCFLDEVFTVPGKFRDR